MTEEHDVFRPTPKHPTGLDAKTYVASLPQFCVSSKQTLPPSPLPDDVIRQGIAITGGGLMGVSISAAFIKSGIPVLMYDVVPEVLATAPNRVAAELALQMPDADPFQLHEAMSLFETTDDMRRLARFDLIVESIYEKPKIKQKHYTALDSVRDRGGYILSNTSTIRIGKLAEVFAPKCKQLSDANFCGFHFFHPVRERSLVEIIRGQATSDETISLAAATARLIGKTPIIVHDGPGFLVNRLLNPYLNEALVLLE
ncbi:MAG: 3-hydroxyacyl-CoA dehydrogenase family protein, partial [Planctomycetia bacterium]|nr:3-hydroxyacyl-CoA dehydrogenase family protein [Planctomycetia bacterium]